jgi:hypothetical protein
MARKRFVSWAVFLALLAGFGFVVHVLAPPKPRWRLHGHLVILGITSDNAHFWTLAVNPEGGYNGSMRGPLQLRELGTGEVVAEYLADAPDLFGCTLSPTGRFVAAYHYEGSNLRLVDRLADVERTIHLDDGIRGRLKQELDGGSIPDGSCSFFSPAEKYVWFREPAGRGDGNCWFGTADGKPKRLCDRNETFRDFLLDDNYAIFSDNRRLKLWNVAKNVDETHRLGNHHFHYYVSPESRRILTCKDHNNSEVAIVDIADGRRTIVSNPEVVRFSRGGRWLFGTNPLLDPQTITVFHVATGERGGQIQLKGFALDDPCTSSDESLCMLTTKSENTNQAVLALEMIRLPDGERLWTRQLDPGAELPDYAFTADDTLLVAFENSMELWDARSGAKRASIWQPNHLGTFSWLQHPSFTHDRRFVLNVALRTSSTESWHEWAASLMPWMFPSGIALVADTAEGRRLLQVAFDAQQQDIKTWLTDDGASLVTTLTDSARESMIYDHRAWDVPTAPRWDWVIGLPAGGGGLFLGWRQWARHKRVRATTRE